ncbi:MAG: hypothetical protein LBJ25_07720 [Candidatus Margulisbacteria bacterium]|jgi:hypothetical protein|nr:hypothetical protein [Candidatus Margulisiibacteriota bacterium]
MPQDEIIEEYFTSAAERKDKNAPPDNALPEGNAPPSGSVLPPVSNTAAAVLDTGAFFANTAEELRRHRSTRAAHQRLGRKSGELARTIFGEFVDSRDAEQVRRAARHAYLLLRQGGQREAASQFKTIAEELQEEIFFVLLDAESGYDLRPARLALGELARGARISPELKARAAEILRDNKRGYFAELTDNLRSSLQTAAAQLDNLPRLAAKPEFQKMAKDIYRLQDAALTAAYAELTERFAACADLTAEQQKLFAERQIGLKELACGLDTAVIALDNVCENFYARLAAPRDRLGTDFSLLENAVRAEQAKKYSALAALLRRIYESSGGTLVLKLKLDAYFLVNAALSGQTTVPLSILFCDLETEAAAWNTPAELDFLDNCYEYSSQYKSGTAVALDVIVKLSRQDAAVVSQWDKTRLDELRKLAEFCGQVRSTLQAFAKKLENIKEIKKMETALLLISTGARFFQELGKALKNLNKDAAVQETLARCRFLLEDTRWLQNIAVFCQYASGHGHFASAR